MCQVFDAPPTGEEQFVLDTPRLRSFISDVNAIRGREREPRAIVAAIRPVFAELLADPGWLPERYREPFEGSGMGSGIGMWLLYRAGDGGLAFSSLVVPAGAQTPVHDHLAWGLVGLYRGAQDEEVFRWRDDGGDEGVAELELTERNALRPGDFYELLPENDIHRVRTTSAETSVSLHLLGNDNGCIWRHRFYPEAGRVEPFRSGYVNVPCGGEG
ncbi:MAG: cysteine dioxygenase family protein [Chloroflexota bacterium]|nr:cysteine dioxygenase family protein [Chloroflexota bacterium]